MSLFFIQEVELTVTLFDIAADNYISFGKGTIFIAADFIQSK